MLQPAIQKNDRKAKRIIAVVSIVIFGAVVMLDRHIIHPEFTLFDVHYFAQANAVINSIVALILIAALLAVKSGHYTLHRNLMISAMILSVLFLLSYICMPVSSSSSISLRQKRLRIKENGALSISVYTKSTSSIFVNGKDLFSR